MQSIGFFMKLLRNASNHEIHELLAEGTELPLAIKHYPSRGQSAVQKLYQTSRGKLFLKRVSLRNHKDCQVDPQEGSLAEREYWAYCLAEKLGLQVPTVWLLDGMTTVQTWIDLPDARQFKERQGSLKLLPENIFHCALFDWITGQLDRHDANYLYDYIHNSIILIDSTHCFLKHTSMPDYLSYFEGVFSEQAMLSLPSPLPTLRPKTLLKLVPLRSEEGKKALLERWEKAISVWSIKEVIGLYRGSKI